MAPVSSAVAKLKGAHPSISQGTKSVYLSVSSSGEPRGVDSYGGYARPNKCALRSFRKVTTEVAERKERGRLFHRAGAHEPKDRLPILVLTLGIDSLRPLFERRERLCVTLLSRLCKYEGCSVDKVLNVRTLILKLILN